MTAAEPNPTPFPFRRAETRAWLARSPAVSVLIIGGGINGAGVLRELAINGIDALLVDKADFTAGATCASSRMIHGGLRYLENGEFRLVREALRERNRLLRNAPHAVFPLETVIPVFRRFSGFGNAARKFLRLGGRPARRGLWVIRVGLALYNRFARDSGMLPAPRIRGRAETFARHPKLNPAALGSACYFDAWNPAPERLCLEVIGDALATSHECRALNYCAVEGADDGQVILRDVTTGSIHSVSPSIVINATGAWIDRTNRTLGIHSQFIGGTRGSHLVLDHPALLEQLGGSELFYENDDGRICLLLPWCDRLLLGTTDIRTDDPDAAVCEADEFDYLRSAARQVFPSIEIRPEQVVARFCGVRPLPRSNSGSPGTISRDHACHETPASAGRPYPVFSLVGGKWTTFRAFSEQVADHALPLLQRTRVATSESLAIGGGRGFPKTKDAREAWIAEHAKVAGIDETEVAVLLRRYGTAAGPILKFISEQGADGSERIGGYLRAELEFLIRHEAVVHVDDLLLRRSMLALHGDLNPEVLLRVTEIAAGVLGWSADRMRGEMNRARNILRQRHAITI